MSIQLVRQFGRPRRIERPVAGQPAADLSATRILPWDPLLIAVAVYLVTAVGRVHQLFSFLVILHPAILSGLAAIALYLNDPRDIRRLKHVLTGPVSWFLALLVWMAFATPVALVIGNSFDLTVNNFSKTVLMSIIIAGSIRVVRDVERLALIYVASATIYACMVLLRFSLGTGAAWRLNDLYYYDANDFATFIVTALPLGLYLLHASTSTARRVAITGALAILALVFVRTGSRGGFIALVAVGIYIVLRYSAIQLRWRVGATALVTTVTLLAASSEYWTQMSTILSDTDYNRTEDSGRMQIWERGVGYMTQFPVFGVGPANFATAEGTLSARAQRQEFGVGVRWNAAHNSYVQVGAELGVPGLVIFLGMIATTFGLLRRARQRGGRAPAPDLAQALTASLLGFVVGACFLSLAYSEMLYTLVALSVGLHKLTEKT